MQEATKPRDQLAIHVAAVDHGRLTGLAQSALDRIPDMAEDLLAEMDRATITDPLPQDVVRMGSTVTFRSGSEEAKRITLVYPGEADIALRCAGRPSGSGLVGRRVGDEPWTVYCSRD